VGLGTQVSLGEIARSLRQWRLVVRAIVLDVVLVPVVMWIAVELLVPDEGYATGLLLVAFAAAGPLRLKLAQVMGADPAFAIGIVVILEVANIVLVPLWASLLGLSSSADILVDIVRTLALLVALPLAMGMAFRSLRPANAVTLGRRALVLAAVGLVVSVAIISARYLDVVLGSVGNGAALASIIVTSFALVAGFLLGGPRRATRLTTSAVTGVGANAAALAVATGAFAGQPAVAAGVVITRRGRAAPGWCGAVRGLHHGRR